MALTSEEEIAFSKIVALSTKDRSTVRDVLFAILTYGTIEAYNQEENEITIPYLCTMNLKYKEVANEKGIESSIDVNATPSATLLKEFVAIKNGEEPMTKKYFKRQNKLHFKKFLNLNEED